MTRGSNGGAREQRVCVPPRTLWMLHIADRNGPEDAGRGRSMLSGMRPLPAAW